MITPELNGHPCLELEEHRPFDHLLELAEQIRIGKDPHHLDRGSTVTTGQIWFRGESKYYDTRLTPKIFREVKIEEAELISEFKRRYPGYRQSCDNDLDWLSVMQHYGMPTRLLDWSTNLLIALYFALGDPVDLENDGFVYVLPIAHRHGTPERPFEPLPIFSRSQKVAPVLSELATKSTRQEVLEWVGKRYPTALNQQGILLDNSLENHYRSPLFSDSIIEVFAHQFHPRITAQSGVFTIHSGKYLNGKTLIEGQTSRLASSHWKNTLFHIRIPKEAKVHLLTKLRLMGISHSSIYPEEEHFHRGFLEARNIN